MKTYWLSLLAGTALLGGVGMASAAEPAMLTPTEPVMLTPTDMDQITAGGWERKKWEKNFKKWWWKKKFDDKKFKHARKHRDHRGGDGHGPSTSPSDTAFDVTVNIGPGAIANVVFIVGKDNVIKDVKLINIVDNKFVVKK